MDHLTVWINNHQLLDRIDNNDLQSIQDVIIQNVFGGFDKLLLDLMKNYKQLSLEKQLKIYNILLTKHDEDMYDNYKSMTKGNNNKLCIFDVSDDCLIHIMKFLNDNDIYAVQQTSRLFAIISRNESIFDTTAYDEYFSAEGYDPFGFDDPRCINYSITPNKQLIINGVLSNDAKKKQSSINHLATMIRCGDGKFLSHIKHHSKSLQLQLQNDILQNILIEKDYLTIFIYDFEKTPNKHSLSILTKILKHIVNCQSNDSDKKEQHDGTMDILNGKSLLKLLRTFSRICKRFIFDIMNNKELVSALISIFCNYRKYQPSPAVKKKSIFGDSDSDDDPLFAGMYYNLDELFKVGIKMFNKILGFEYDTHKTILFQNGIMSLFRTNVITRYDNQYMLTEFIKKLIKNISHENLEMVINDDEGLRIILNLIKRNNMNIIIDLFKSSNYEQREILINYMIEVQMFNTGYNQQYIDKIMNMLNEQILLFTAFKSAFYVDISRVKKKVKTTLFPDDDSDDFFSYKPKKRKRTQPIKITKKPILFPDDDEEDDLFTCKPKKKTKKLKPGKSLFDTCSDEEEEAIPIRKQDDAMDNDSELEKWSKMLKVGVPKVAVIERMKREGLTNDIIDGVIDIHKSNLIKDGIQNAWTHKDPLGASTEQDPLDTTGLGLSNLPPSMKASLLLLDEEMSSSDQEWNSDD